MRIHKRTKIYCLLVLLLCLSCALGLFALPSKSNFVQASTTSEITDYHPNYFPDQVSKNITTGYFWGDDSNNSQTEYKDHCVNKGGLQTAMQYVKYSLSSSGNLRVTVHHNTHGQYATEKNTQAQVGGQNLNIGSGLVAITVNDSLLTYKNESWKSNTSHVLSANIPDFKYNVDYKIETYAFAKWSNGFGWAFHYKGVSTVTMGYEDHDPPTGTLSANGSKIESGTTTKYPVSFKFTESGAEAYLDGNKYYSNTSITQEGSHTITLSDQWGNTSYYYFTIDNTPPTGTLTGVDDGSYTNSSVRFTWSESGATAQIKKDQGTYSPYTKNSVVSSEGSYTILLTDRAGNNRTYTFTIDKTPPVGKIRSNGQDLPNGASTRFSVQLYWDEANITATFSNGTPYVKNATLMAEGDYYITLTDRAKNSTPYYFTIDKTAPSGSLSGVSNGGITTTTVYFTWQETTATATLDGYRYTSGTAISTEGYHTIVLKDSAGNSSTYNFTIDKTPPVGVLNGVDNGGLTNKSVRFSWSETTATATLDGLLYALGTTISAEGQHEIVLTDRAGNYTIYTFTIDKTAPIGNLTGVDPDGSTNGTVTFTWQETTATATLDGNAYTSGTAINTEGAHVIVLTDRASNKATYTFTIDKTPPVGNLNGVLNGGLTNKTVTFSWSETTATATLDNDLYISGTYISAEGQHEIILTDRVGNATTYTFTIDKTAPVGELIGVDDGGTVNTSVYFQWREDNCTITVNGATSSFAQEGEYYRCQVDGPVDAKTLYSVVLIDQAGNKAYYSFTIDKRLPTGTLRDSANNVLYSGATTNKSFSFTANSANVAITLDGEQYVSGTTISAPDNTVTIYVFYLIDTLGNVNSYTITVNRVRPTIDFYDAADKLLSVKPDTPFYYNANVKIISDPALAITCNSRPFTSAYLMVGENEVVNYTIKITNELGNTNTYNIELDTIPYLRNLNDLYNTYRHHINKWWETYTYTLTNNQYVQGTMYAFSNSTDAASYAFSREMEIAEYHEAYNGGNIYCDWAKRYVDGIDVPNIATMVGQPYYIYRDQNNASKLVAYFNVSSLNAAVNKYAAASVKMKTIPSTPAAEYPGDTFLERQQINTDYIYINTSSFSLHFSSSDNTLIVNGSVVDYSYVFNEGINTVLEIDRAGNETRYIIMLDTAVADATAYDFAENILSELTYDFNSKQEIYFNNPFRIRVSDAIDANCLMTVTLNGITTQIFAGEAINYYDFTQNGIYTISWEDIAGNKKQVTLYLSLIGPSIEITENKDSMDSLVSFSVSVKKNLNFNQVLALSVWLSTDGGEYIQLSQDDTGINITPATLNYTFLQNGKYRVLIIDRFGVESIQEYEFKKNAPTGSLFTENNGILANGARVNGSVKFTWKDPYATAYLNGAEYTKDALIMNEGEYTIELRDKSGNITVYTFVIDKTPPAYNLQGVENGGATNQNVTLNWDVTAEPGASAEIKKGNGAYNMYTNGAVISAEGTYSIRITDAAGNSKVISFTINKTAPDIVITDTLGKVVPSDSIINRNIKITYSSGTVYVNGQLYTKGTTISADGLYTIYLEDRLGNTNTARIRIDKTINAGNLVGVENGGYTNQDVYFSWTDSDVTAMLNGLEYVSGTAITVSEGETQAFTIVMTDRAGNKLVYEFTISKTTPTGKFTDTLNNPLDGDFYTNKSVKFSWTATGSTAILDGQSYSSGTIINVEGTHVIVLTDRAGNKATYTFTIDKTPPVGELLGVQNGGYTNSDVTFSWNEVGVFAILDGAAFSSGSTITLPIGQSQKFTIVLTDRAGNNNTYTFTIDRIAPKGQFEDYSGNQYDNNFTTNKTVYFSWSETTATATLDGLPYVSGTSIGADGQHQLILTDRVGNTAVYDFIIDKAYPTFKVYDDLDAVVERSDYYNHSVSFSFSNLFSATLNGQNYVPSTSIVDEGNYVFVLKNEVGTTVTYTFTIDKTAPTGTLSGVDNHGVTRQSVTCIWSEAGLTATLDGVLYVSGKTISEEGQHQIVLIDRAGNITTYEFEIDKTPPTGSLAGVNNGGATNQEVSFTWADSNVTATLNGLEYASGTAILIDGDYELVLTDPAGNTTIYTFQVNTKLPVGELIGVENGGTTKKNVSFVFSGKGLTATLNGVEYVSGKTISAEGSYTIVLSDAAGNNNTYTFRIYKQEVLYEIIGANGDGYSNETISIEFNENHTVTVNGNAYASGDLLDQEGVYNIVITNISGASKEFTLIIDRTPPQIQLYDDANNMCGFETNKSFRIVPADNDIKNIWVNGEPYNNNLIFREGEYTILVEDRAGNNSTFFVYLRKTPPVGKFNVDFINNTTAHDVIFIFDSEYTATLNGAPYNGDVISTPTNTKSDYTIVLADRYGNISSYSFTINKILPVGEFVTQSGQTVAPESIVNAPVKLRFNSQYSAWIEDQKYVSDTWINGIADEVCYIDVMLKDKLGNIAYYSITIDLTKPMINEDFSETFYSNKDVAFTWNGEGLTALLNGATYESGTLITAEGVYEFVLKNEVGTTVAYTFTIDKTPPVIDIDKLRENNYVTSSTAITWDDLGLSVTVNGEAYAKGDRITKDGTYTVIATDRAGNVTEIAFTIYKDGPSVSVDYKGSNSDLVDNKTYYADVTIISSDTIIVNGNSVSSGTVLHEEGAYIIEIVNVAGVKTTYNITIKAPAATEGNGGITVLINTLVALISVAVAIVFSVLIIKTIKKNKRGLL